MKIVDIRERDERGHVIEHDVFDYNSLTFGTLYEYPLVVDIKPGDNLGDIIDTYGKKIIAPHDWKKFELWHIILNGCHVRYYLKKVA